MTQQWQSGEDYARQKRAEKQKYNQDLTEALARMAENPAFWRTYLEVQGRLSQLSVGNAMMVARQYPAARLLRLSTEWDALGVRPLRGAQGIALLIPGEPYRRQDGSLAQGYDVRRAFDVSQTNYKGQLPAMPDQQTLLRGLLEYQKGAWEFRVHSDGEDARYDPTAHVLSIRRQQPFAPLYPALAREVVCADLLLRYQLPREESEPLAISAAYMLCSRYRANPVDLDLPDPRAVMGADAGAFRAKLSMLLDPLRGVIHATEPDPPAPLLRPPDREAAL